MVAAAAMMMAGNGMIGKGFWGVWWMGFWRDEF